MKGSGSDSKWKTNVQVSLHGFLPAIHTEQNDGQFENDPGNRTKKGSGRISRRNDIPVLTVALATT